MAIGKSKEFAQLEHLQLDDDHDIDVKMDGQIVQRPAMSQMVTFNQEARLYVNGKQYMHPTNHRIIQDKTSKTGFEFDPHGVVAPNHEDTPHYEQAEQTKVQSVVTDRQAIKGMGYGDTQARGINKCVREEEIQLLKKQDVRIQHEPLLKNLENEVKDAEMGMGYGNIQARGINQCIREKEHQLLKNQDVRIQQECLLKKLEKEVKDAEMAIRNGDSYNRILDENIGELNRQLVRKREDSKQKEQTLKKLQGELREPEMGDLMPLPRQNAGSAGSFQGYGAVASRDPPPATCNRLDGTNNTQIIINGNIHGSLNNNGNQAESSMINVALALIIALVACVLFR